MEMKRGYWAVRTLGNQGISNSALKGAKVNKLIPVLGNLAPENLLNKTSGWPQP